MYVDNVEGEWGAFNEIMKRKDAAVQAQVGSLQMKIVAEDKVVEQKTTELLQEWEKGKPVQVWGNIGMLWMLPISPRTTQFREQNTTCPVYAILLMSLVQEL